MYNFSIEEFAHELGTYTPEAFEAEWDYVYADHVNIGIIVKVNLTRVCKILTCGMTFKELDARPRNDGETIESIFAGAFYKQLEKIAIRLID